MKKKFTQVVTFISAYLFSFSKEEFATKLKQPLFFSLSPFPLSHSTPKTLLRGEKESVFLRSRSVSEERRADDDNDDDECSLLLF